MDALLTLREKINHLDHQLIDLLAQRFKVCLEVARYKKLHGIPMMQPARIEEIKKTRTQWAEEKNLSPLFVACLFESIIHESCQLEDTFMNNFMETPEMTPRRLQTAQGQWATQIAQKS